MAEPAAWCEVRPYPQRGQTRDTNTKYFQTWPKSILRGDNLDDCGRIAGRPKMTRVAGTEPFRVAHDIVTKSRFL
jgi:hypothetical protein